MDEKYVVDKLMPIEALDVDKALKNCNGNVVSYYNKLYDFLQKAPEILYKYEFSNREDEAEDLYADINLLKNLVSDICAQNCVKKCDSLVYSLIANNTAESNVLFFELLDDIKELCSEINNCASGNANQPIKSNCDIVLNSEPLAVDTSIDNLLLNYLVTEVPINNSPPPETGDPELDNLLKNYMAKVNTIKIDPLKKSEPVPHIAKTSSRVDAKDADFINALEMSDSTENDTGKLKILVVDNKSDALIVVKSILENQYNVFCAANHEIATKYLSSQTPDIILLNIEIPSMDGFALMDIIRSMPANKDTPIIFLSENVKMEYILKAKEKGVSELIKKPVDKTLLLGKIEAQIKKRIMSYMQA